MDNVTTLPSKVTAASLRAEAEAEVRASVAKDAKEKIKRKLLELTAAQKVVANIERELEVLAEQVSADLG